MIKQFAQSVAYNCPVCAAVTVKKINIFDFSGKKKSELVCGADNCHESAAYISESKDKYKIRVECPFCGEMHEYTLKKTSFWNRDFFAFKCPVSNMNVFFAGETDKVKKAVNKQEEALSEYYKGFEAETGLSVMFGIVSVINDMFQQGEIVCECGSEHILMNMEEEGIILSCQNCGAVLDIAITEEEYEKLLNTDILTITK